MLKKLRGNRYVVLVILLLGIFVMFRHSGHYGAGELFDAKDRSVKAIGKDNIRAHSVFEKSIEKDGQRNHYVVENYSLDMTALNQLQRFCGLLTEHTGKCEINLTDLTKLKLVLQVIKTLPNAADLLQNRFGYESTVNEIRAGNSSYLEVRIEEFSKTKGRKTSGGSSFKGVVRGFWTIATCTVVDYFNGTYHLQCPVTEPCVSLVVNATFPMYTAYYTTTYTPFPETLVSKAICQKHAKYNKETLLRGVHDLVKSRKTCTYSDMQWAPGEGYWISKQSITDKDYIQWKWTTKSCHPRLDPTKSGFEKCYQKFSHIFVAGDSHARFQYYYLLDKIGALPSNLPEKLRETKTVGNLTFLWSSFARTLYDSMHEVHTKFLSNSSMIDINSDKPILIIMGLGSWDLRFNSYIEFLIDFETFVERFKVLKSSYLWRNVRIIWYTTYPVRELYGWESMQNLNQATHEWASPLRNNQEIAALNAWVSKQLRALGVDIFDSYDIIYPRCQEAVCGDHYL